MDIQENNYAFIDSQNLHLGIQKLGWKLDHQRFRIYLKEKYDITKAYVFIGYVESNKDLYSILEEAGFILVFKKTAPDDKGNIKGNKLDSWIICNKSWSIKKHRQRTKPMEVPFHRNT